ncbi:MAG: metallophosphoesterase family protein [Balneolaceae bacterium]|nr:metallophosphoesterase family protein [Balneolaceae bacterium]
MAKRIAVVSDVHGNAQALEAVLADIGKNSVDSIICLGDIVTFGPSPREIIEMLQQHNCSCVMGNHEEALFDPENTSVYEIEGEALQKSVYWCLNKLYDKDLSFIRSFKKTVSVPLDDEIDMLCYHGSPHSTIRAVLPTSSPEEIDSLIKFDNSTKIAIGGHTHFQMYRKHKEHILLNAGSVGSAFMHPFISPPVPTYLPVAEYAIVEVMQKNISVDLKSIEYDFPKFQNLILASDIPLKGWWEGEFNRINGVQKR